jgi:urease gamma subunit
MPQRKQPREEWITGKEAADILSARSGHKIAQNYVRFLAYKAHKISYRARDGRTNEYLKSDVEGIMVREQGKGDQVQVTENAGSAAKDSDSVM